MWGFYYLAKQYTESLTCRDVHVHFFIFYKSNMAESKAPIVILLMFLLFGAAGAFYYFFIYKKTKATPSPSPSVSTSTDSTSTDSPASASTSTSTSPPASTSTTDSPPASTLESLLAMGQALENGEIDVGSGKSTVANQPVITDKTKVKYSLSMDIKVDKTAVGNFRLLHNRGDDDNSSAIASSVRRPEIWISGSSHSDGANHVWINHVVGATGYSEGFKQTTFKATEGVYFNLTYVIDGGKCIVYINGVKDSEYSGDFRWSQAEDSWTWNMFSQSHSIRVKNVYFFNKALALSEVELIGKKQTSGVSTYVLPPTYKVASQPSIQMYDI